jgi:hypothetical protein
MPIADRHVSGNQHPVGVAWIDPCRRSRIH